MTVGDAIGWAVFWFFMREIIAAAIVILFYAIGGFIGWKTDRVGAAFGILFTGWFLAIVWQIIAVIFLVGDISTVVNLINT